MKAKFILAGFYMSVLVACAAGAENGAVHEGAESSNPVFQGYQGEAVWTVLSFALLVVVLWRTAWKPLLASLTARQEHIKKEIDDATKVRRQADEVLEQYKNKLAQADEEGKKIVLSHTSKAEKQSKEIITKARHEVESMKARASEDMQRNLLEAEYELWNQAGEMVRKLGQEVLGKSLTEQEDAQLMEQAIERLRAEQSKSGESSASE